MFYFHYHELQTCTYYNSFKSWLKYVDYLFAFTNCEIARRDRCQEYHNCFPFGELEETTRTSSYYMDEDYPARPEIKQSLPGWGDNCGSESSTLETDVCVWHYAPLVVLATQEEEDSPVWVFKDSKSSVVHLASHILIYTVTTQ